eukprot:jgi/Pico_ML_1/50756/g1910.t1
MKFGKLLRNTAEAQPEWADAYLDYKLLKKKLKALKRNEEDADANGRDNGEAANQHWTEARADSQQGAGVSQLEKPELTTEEQEFITTLNEELNKFNNFFMEKEEEHVINLRNYEDRARVLLSEEEADVERLQRLIGS